MVMFFLLFYFIFFLSSSFTFIKKDYVRTIYSPSTLGLAKTALKTRQSDWCRLNKDTGVVTLLRAAGYASKYDAVGNILGTLRHFQEWTRADFIESSLLTPWMGSQLDSEGAFYFGTMCRSTAKSCVIPFSQVAHDIITVIVTLYI